MSDDESLDMISTDSEDHSGADDKTKKKDEPAKTSDVVVKEKGGETEVDGATGDGKEEKGEGEGEEDEDESSKGQLPAGIGDSKHKSKRGCTDVLCLLFFIIFWIGMITVGIIGFVLGDPARLIYPVDYEGNLCGNRCAAYDNGTSLGCSAATGDQTSQGSCGCVTGGGSIVNKTFVFYPRLNEDLQAYAIRVLSNPSSALSLQLYGACVEQCPAIGDIVCDYDFDVQYRSALLGRGYSTTSVDTFIQDCVQWYRSNCLGGICLGSRTNQGFPGGSSGSCETVGVKCRINLFQQKNVYKACFPLSDPEETYTREICSDPVEEVDASWTCTDITSGATAVTATFQTGIDEQQADLASCQTAAQNQYATGNYDSSNASSCTVEKCVCNPSMCLASDLALGQRATGPQIYLPTTLSDNRTTVLEENSGCNVVNRTTYSFSEELAAKGSMLQALQSGYDWLNVLISDLIATLWLVGLLGGVFPVVAGFLYLGFIRICLKCLIVVVEILIILSLLFYALYALLLGGVIPPLPLCVS